MADEFPGFTAIRRDLHLKSATIGVSVSNYAM